MHRQKTERAITFEWKTDKPDTWEKLRYEAAKKLNTWHEHKAGGGSRYITIGDTKLRFANHENFSTQYGAPDYNFVNRKPTDEEIREITCSISYPKYCKQRAFALHTGFTVPGLKKAIGLECYEDVCLNKGFSNTLTKVVVVSKAIKKLNEMGVTQRIPIRQETRSKEDYCGW